MKCAFIIIYGFQDYFSCGNKAFGEEDIWSSSLDWKMMFSYEHTIPENDDPVTSIFFFLSRQSSKTDDPAKIQQLKNW